MYSSSILSRRKILKKSFGNTDVETLYSSLPGAAYELSIVLNNSETLLSVLSRFGGCTLRIPARWPPHGQSVHCRNHDLRKVLTGKQMEKVVAHFAGTDVYIPKCTQYLRNTRNAAIIKYFSNAARKGTSSGVIVQRLAQRFQLSDRRIWTILKESVGITPLEKKRNTVSFFV